MKNGWKVSHLKCYTLQIKVTKLFPKHFLFKNFLSGGRTPGLLAGIVTKVEKGLITITARKGRLAVSRLFHDATD